MPETRHCCCQRPKYPSVGFEADSRITAAGTEAALFAFGAKGMLRRRLPGGCEPLTENWRRVYGDATCRV